MEIKSEYNDMILRDHLALDRTIMANERTLLAWIRTAISIIVAGVGFIKIFDEGTLQLLGVVLIFIGMITFSFGIKRYYTAKIDLKKIRGK